MSFIQTSLNYFELGAIAAASGVASVYSHFYVSGICKSSTSELRNYLCLKSATFFEPRNLAAFFRPIVQLKESTAGVFNHFIPHISSHYSESCMFLFKLFENLSRLESIFPSEELKLMFLDWKKFYLETAQDCCKVKNSSEVQASALAEEFVFRMGIQKIGLLALAKLFPNRIGKVLSHQITRITIASFIFAFAHHYDNVVSQFLGGVIDGVVFEKYGLLASTISHSAHNHLLYSMLSNSCDGVILSLALKQSELIASYKRDGQGTLFHADGRVETIHYEKGNSQTAPNQA